MCTYISVVLPPEADFSIAVEAFRAAQLSLKPLDEGTPPNGVEKWEQYYFTCNSMCDCGTSLGWLGRRDRTESNTLREVLIADLRRKGWSAAKIERRLSELERKVEKDERTTEALKEKKQEEIDRWLKLLDALIRSKRFRYAGVTVNDYSGRIGNPKFGLDRELIRLAELNSKLLEEMKPRALYLIHP
jgi:hypothetical protein